MKIRRATIDLFLVSALGLYVELIFIRWAASELRMLAFYKNFALIAAFLGLGLGFTLFRKNSHSRLFERYFFPLLALGVVLILLIGRTPLSELVLLNRDQTQEFIWAGQVELVDPRINFLLDFAFYSIITVLFLLITLIFLPLGELTARKFSVFRPLQGYTINVLGSLAGILAYTLISFLGWPPGAWFLINALAGLYLLASEKSRLAFQGLAAAVPILLTIFWPTGAEQTLWSPYYRIDLSPKSAALDPRVQIGYELSVNQAWHQRLWNLDPSFVRDNYNSDPQHFDQMVVEYDTPYQAPTSLSDVLIVGAGTGNDVAAALRAGASHIVAVEIDPLILKIGQELHPEQPYADNERVTRVIQDARSFFRRDTGRYDLIVFGLLDSHTLFSTASSVRLDNFVYTIESMHDVRRLLKPDGLVALLFGVPEPHGWVRERLFRTLTDAFGHPPQSYLLPDETILFLIGLNPITEPLIKNPAVRHLADYPYRENLDPVTDDWPFMYLQEPSIPNTYLIGLTIVIVLSWLMIRRVVPTFRQLHLHFFFMGAAFFLLETKSITEMALLFGSTWIVNAAVIATILCMIVLANLLVDRLHLSNTLPYYALLLVSLLFDFLVPVRTYLQLSLGLRVLLVCVTQAIPLFFAGIIFAITFNQTTSISDALGSNLIGSVLGGVFEYTSLVLGIRSLYLLALGFYLLSMVALLAQTRRITAASPS